MRILAFITEALAVRDILAHLGEPTSPPRLAPARDPPLWEMLGAGQGEIDPQAQPGGQTQMTSRSMNSSTEVCSRRDWSRRRSNIACCRC
jgi:hypothetical protein